LCFRFIIFYIFFESVLIPMFLIIGIWGSRERKILAAYYFFLYTLLGSVLMLLSILYIYYQVGTTDYEVLLTFSFSTLEQKFLWFTFFLAFASKVPMVPVHLWLPEAHVEAPTAGSVILAGVLLKLGTYGFIRFSLPLFPQASFFFTPLVYTIAVIGIIYTSFTAIRQTDFKRIIAYTSIAHMNLVILGIFSFNNIGIEGAIFYKV
jgi:proton-translocating NADH-quinone oxidoreductase chain M